MYFERLFVPGLSIFTYLVADDGGECVVVDPPRDIDDVVATARRHDLRIRHIVETHVHADFVSGALELAERLPVRPRIICSGEGGERWVPDYADVVASDGFQLRFGELRLRALHTPGHTPEHMTWVLFDESRSNDTAWLALTGDFLFVGDVGRPDLLGEAAQKALAKELYESVFETLPAYPDFTEVFPGHGPGSLCGKAIGSRYSSTLGYERRFNAALQLEEQGAWIEHLLDGMPEAPAYFQRMKQINSTAPRVLGGDLPGRRPYSPDELASGAGKEAVVLDTRSKEAFASGHVPGAINIPFADSFATWAGWVLPYDKPILIVAEESSQVPKIVRHLSRVGHDNVAGYLDGGMGAWETAGKKFRSIATASVTELMTMVGTGGPLVLDVRSQSEWDAGHIPGATHIHAGKLRESLDTIPRDRSVAVVCGSGYRASIASSLLAQSGVRNVTNILGGMSAYMAAELPVVQGEG